MTPHVNAQKLTTFYLHGKKYAKRPDLSSGKKSPSKWAVMVDTKAEISLLWKIKDLHIIVVRAKKTVPAGQFEGIKDEMQAIKKEVDSIMLLCSDLETMKWTVTDMEHCLYAHYST